MGDAEVTLYGEGDQGVRRAEHEPPGQRVTQIQLTVQGISQRVSQDRFLWEHRGNEGDTGTKINDALIHDELVGQAGSEGLGLYYDEDDKGVAKETGDVNDEGYDQNDHGLAGRDLIWCGHV